MKKLTLVIGSTLFALMLGEMILRIFLSPSTNDMRCYHVKDPKAGFDIGEEQYGNYIDYRWGRLHRKHD